MVRSLAADIGGLADLRLTHGQQNVRALAALCADLRLVKAPLNASVVPVIQDDMQAAPGRVSAVYGFDHRNGGGELRC